MRPGRDEAFSQFVVGHRGDLVRTATLLAAGDRHLAEDLVQVSLTRLYLAWGSLRAPEARHAYARRTLVNALIDETRRSWRRREQSRAELPEMPTPDGDEMPTPDGEEPDERHPGAPAATGEQNAVLTPGSLQLVDYTGDQLAGYSVDEVPEGWTLLHSDEYALTIGPAGVPDTNPASYLGKLTVLLMSTDERFPAQGTPVQVGDTAGLAVPEPQPTADDPFDFSLYYVDAASGQPVRIQVPTALHWTAEQAAEFAAGVHVTDAAQRAHG